MRRSLTILVLLAALLAAGDARAAPAPALMPDLLPPRLLTEVGVPVPPPTPFHSGFSARAERYEVRLFTFGTAVILEVTHGKRRHFAATAYLARGVAVPDRLQATFGKFGKVSMRFRRSPSAGVKSLCRFGRRFTRRRGSYVGSFKFEGEDGYLSIRLHRARGSIVAPAGRCPRPHHHFSRAEVEKAIEELFSPTSGIRAGARAGVATTEFVGRKRSDRDTFFAFREETHGKLAVIRYAFAAGKKGLRANEAATAASASPPVPFHGTGRYRAGPDGSTSWTGALSVNFPGAPRFPLTGPGFESFLEVPF